MSYEILILNQEWNFIKNFLFAQLRGTSISSVSISQTIYKFAYIQLIPQKISIIFLKDFNNDSSVKLTIKIVFLENKMLLPVH